VAGPFESAYSLTKSGTTNADKLMISSSGAPRAGDSGRFDLQFNAETRSSNRSICLSAAGQTRTIDLGGSC
jgi:hypothetical protein